MPINRIFLYLKPPKAHRILLGSALFKLFEIKTTGPPKQEKKTNELSIDVNL